MRTCLIDTGPFVSYLDRKDPGHADVADFLDNLKGQLITTGAVVGEVMYFVSELPNGPVSFADRKRNGEPEWECPHGARARRVFSSTTL